MKEYAKDEKHPSDFLIKTALFSLGMNINLPINLAFVTLDFFISKMENFCPEFSFLLGFSVGYLIGNLVYSHVNKYFDERLKINLTMFGCVISLSILPIFGQLFHPLLAFVTCFFLCFLSGIFIGIYEPTCYTIACGFSNKYIPFISGGTAFGGVFNTMIRIFCTLFFASTSDPNLNSVVVFYFVSSIFIIVSIIFGHFLLNEFQILNKQHSSSKFLSQEMLNINDDKEIKPDEINHKQINYKSIFLSSPFLFITPFLLVTSHYFLYPGFYLAFKFKSIESLTWKNIFICVVVTSFDFVFRFLPAFVMILNEKTIRYAIYFRLLLLINLICIPFMNGTNFFSQIMQSDLYKTISIIIYVTTFSYPFITGIRLLNVKKVSSDKERNIINNLIFISVSPGLILAGILGTFILSHIA